MNLEFWLGLKRLSELTREGSWELLVELTDYRGTTYTARYTGFRVGGAATKYRMQYDMWDKENSTVGTLDGLAASRGQKFSTADQGRTKNSKHIENTVNIWLHTFFIHFYHT